jgi:hypothetical protein
MEKVIRQGTSKTPLVILNPEDGIITLEGRSILEDTISFYDPILSWLAEYVIKPKETTTLNISFDYFNSTSARILLIILQTIQQVRKHGNNLVINWYFDENDENIRESGTDFASLVKENFNFIAKT